MRIELEIPEAYASTIATLAQDDGITPTQWVVRLIKASLRPQQGQKYGRPAVNTERDKVIAAKRRAGYTPLALAKEYGVSEIRIHQICRANPV